MAVEGLQSKVQDLQASCDSAKEPEQEAKRDHAAEHVASVEPDCSKIETQIRPEEAIYAPASIKSNAASHPRAHSKRFFIIKSLNYHNIEKSIQKGIWATQAMNERILNEAFETAGKVLLIFSVNMSGHFQGYAQMMSPIGRRKVNVWSEANWGGTFSVEWIRLFDLPFQKTLHLKNPLNSFKPVKISRDCQELTTEIGEALCALMDEGAQGEYSKGRIHVRSDYFTKRPYSERLPSDNPGYFPTSLRCEMQSVVHPPSILHHAPVRSRQVKYPGSSSSRPRMQLSGGFDLDHQEDREARGLDASREEDLLNMSYEEYLQFRKSSRDSKYQQQALSGSQLLAQSGGGWSGKGYADMHPDDAYASYLANWYANQQSFMMQNGYYQAGPAVSNSFRSSSQPS